jgi:hypothetical protein
MGINLFVDYYARLLPAIPLVLMVAAIIIGFDCIWRVQKHLKLFMVLLTIGMIVNSFRKLVVIVGYTDVNSVLVTTQYLDIIGIVFFLAAFIEMYRIIRSLDGEMKKH